MGKAHVVKFVVKHLDPTMGPYASAGLKARLPS